MPAAAAEGGRRRRTPRSGASPAGIGPLHGLRGLDVDHARRDRSARSAKPLGTPAGRSAPRRSPRSRRARPRRRRPASSSSLPPKRSIACASVVAPVHLDVEDARHQGEQDHQPPRRENRLPSDVRDASWRLHRGGRGGALGEIPWGLQALTLSLPRLWNPPGLRVPGPSGAAGQRQRSGIVTWYRPACRAEPRSWARERPRSSSTGAAQRLAGPPGAAVDAQHQVAGLDPDALGTAAADAPRRTWKPPARRRGSSSMPSSSFGQRATTSVRDLLRAHPRDLTGSGRRARSPGASSWAVTVDSSISKKSRAELSTGRSSTRVTTSPRFAPRRARAGSLAHAVHERAAQLSPEAPWRRAAAVSGPGTRSPARPA